MPPLEFRHPERFASRLRARHLEFRRAVVYPSRIAGEIGKPPSFHHLRQAPAIHAIERERFDGGLISAVTFEKVMCVHLLDGGKAISHLPRGALKYGGSPGH